MVIPTRNRIGLLERAALPSALNQAGVEIEVLVVDDGSADGTPARVLGLPDERIRLIRNERPQGVAAARNVGIHEAAAPWVAFLDDDDHWSPDKLATQLEALRRTEASFAYCSAVVIAEDGTPTEVMRAPAAETIRSTLLRENAMPAGSSNVIASTTLLRRLHGFDEGLAYLADWDLWIALATTGEAVACEGVLVAYVRHPQRMRLAGRAAVAELERLRVRHEAAGFAPDSGRLLSWVAGEQRRGGRKAQALRTYATATVTYRDLRWLRQILATPLDRNGHGLKNWILRRQEPAAEIARPEWVPAP